MLEVRLLSWWHFKPTKIIAGDVHLRCHLDRKIGNFLLQLLVASDFDGSGRKNEAAPPSSPTLHAQGSLKRQKQEDGCSLTADQFIYISAMVMMVMMMSSSSSSSSLRDFASCKLTLSSDPRVWVGGRIPTRWRRYDRDGWDDRENRENRLRRQIGCSCS